MRQQIRPTDRVHGVITEGGERPNIIPSRCSAHYYVRSKNRKHLQQLKTKVMRCFEAAANATGCSLVYEWVRGTLELSCQCLTSLLDRQAHFRCTDKRCTRQIVREQFWPLGWHPAFQGGQSPFAIGKHGYVWPSLRSI